MKHKFNIGDIVCHYIIGSDGITYRRFLIKKIILKENDIPKYRGKFIFNKNDIESDKINGYPCVANENDLEISFQELKKIAAILLEHAEKNYFILFEPLEKE